MFNFIRNFIWGVLLIFTISCAKEEIINNEDLFLAGTEELSELKVETSAVGHQFIEVQWNTVKSTLFKVVTYSVYIDDRKVIENLSENKYSLVNLQPGQEYSIKIMASTKEGKQTQQMLTVSTLSLEPNEGDEVLYKEFKIHSYSTLTGSTGLAQFSNGGHLILKYLSHSAEHFGNGPKLIVFRIDMAGNIMWYRLFSSAGMGLSTESQFNVVLHNEEKEGILFLGSHIFKVSTGDGELLLKKDLRDINEGGISNVLFTADRQILVSTTKTGLLKLSAEDLKVLWHQAKIEDQTGSLLAINIDSKKNIYVAFSPYYQSFVRVLKYSSDGKYITYFQYDMNSITASLIVDDEDNLSLFSSNIHSYDYLHFLKFNTEGEIIKHGVIYDGLTSARAFLNGKNEIIVFGRRDGRGITTNGGVFIFDKEINIKKKKYYDSISSNVLSGLTINRDGSYNLFLHYTQTYTYENPNFIFIKTDVNGDI